MIGKNNPFNVRYVIKNCWKGQTGSTNGFCDFESLDYGIRAAAYLLMHSYRRRGIKTIDGIIKSFAPETENDTDRYIAFVSADCGYPRYRVLDSVVMYCYVLSAMSKFETSRISFIDIFSVINKFNIKLYEKE